MAKLDNVMTLEQSRKASANPTKRFFVSMLTRDITVEDCILDLIDNSVDGAWRGEGSKPMGLGDDTDLSKYTIWINASSDRFGIADNCGGMTLDEAIEHAFSFGRRATDEHDDYSIGVYGIGMKRAVFKLGTNIRIRSTYTDTSGRQSFAVPIYVDEWLKNDTPPWDFDLEADDPLEEDGVEIVIEGLTSGAASSFGSPLFLQNLRRVIARDYSIHLNRGLKIFINNNQVQGWKIELLKSDEFSPQRIEYTDEIDGHKVSVELIGGMAAPPPESNEPDEADEAEKRYGWYVACNGRIVLSADKSSVSGWGTEEWPQWHPQYSGFIGIIFFISSNALALPLTTTKRSVDTTSEIFKRARPRMRELSKKWIAYTNARKQALEQAKAKEASAKPVSIYAVAPQSSVRLPRLVGKTAEPKANIHYSVPVARLKKLAVALGSINLTYREVGLKSFDYTFDDLVGKD